VSAVAQGAAAAFVTLLVPRDAGAPAPLLLPGADGTLHIDLLRPDGVRDTLRLGEPAVWTRRAADGGLLREAGAE
jgi:hypothetical protein